MLMRVEGESGSAKCTSSVDNPKLAGGEGFADGRALAQELFERACTAIETASPHHDYPSVIELLRQAIRINPSEPNYFVSLGTAYAHGGQHDYALAAFEMALQLAPEHVLAARNRRKALEALGLPENTQIGL